MRILINEKRIKRLNDFELKKGKYVLYWMQSSQRTKNNVALSYSIIRANKLNKPLVVFFGITPAFPEGNLRHYTFMIEGLKEVRNNFNSIGAEMVFDFASPEIGAIKLAKESCLVIVDKGYLRILKQWYKSVADRIKCPLIQVEDNVVVPVNEASPKEEYSAATLRPKIENKKNEFLKIPSENTIERYPIRLSFDSFDLRNFYKVAKNLRLEDSIGNTENFQGGTSEALKRLENFVKNKLSDYAELRNDPTQNCFSDLSPYLHFGQISPIQVAIDVLKSPASNAAKEAYLKELIIRRELAINYAEYNQEYDSYAGLSNWAKQTLEAHKGDDRGYAYTFEQLENGKTHDPYWNAAQNEMRTRGKMHGYMRMYWGKKIIEWSRSPKTAFDTALNLNNKYELDGRDPNGFAGVAWCFGKHDRPLKERLIFGTVRYMNAKGLRRKYDINKYVENVKSR
jgi:deoxyribodipyrimidine photo-lyase